MFTNAKMTYDEDLPQNCFMIAVPKSTHLWLKCLKRKDGRWKVILIDPFATLEKEVWRSVSNKKISSIIEALYEPSNWTSPTEPLSILDSDLPF